MKNLDTILSASPRVSDIPPMHKFKILDQKLGKILYGSRDHLPKDVPNTRALAQFDVVNKPFDAIAIFLPQNDFLLLPTILSNVNLQLLKRMLTNLNSTTTFIATSVRKNPNTSIGEDKCHKNPYICIFAVF